MADRKASRRWRLVPLAALALLAGCAEQLIRKEADSQLRAGRYGEAVTALERGLAGHPDSVMLRGALLQAKTEAATRLLAEASALVEQDRLDEAQALLEKARGFDTGATRAAELLKALDIERRQRQAREQAQALVAKGQVAAAQKVIAEALKANPRHEALLQLQRQLDAQARQARFKAAQLGLAEQRPISLDFRDASLRSVLDVVSRHSGINFILDKDIRAEVRVTAYLKSARVEDALDLIIGTNQLAKKIVDGQTILIYPNTPDKQKEYQEQVVRVFHLANAEAKNAAAFLRSMLKLRDPYVDERANLLALREAPETIQMAERLVALFDAGEPEVLLELEVIEVSSNRLTELGVQFPNSFSLSVLAPSGNQLTLGNAGDITRNNIGVSVSNLLVNLKRTVGDVNTLASPRIRVKSREKAKVLIGDKIPVITATTGTGGFVADSVSYIEVGLKLEVEPVVYADDDVAIKVGLEVSSLGTQVKTASGSLAYQIGTRNANTLLRLHDGQTQLLAGLISRDERSSAARVPGLGDVPVLGRLFSSQSDSSQRTELVLAITPRVLRNAHRPDVSEAELWVGTEALPRLRPPFGRVDLPTEEQPKAAAGAAGGASSPPAPAGPSLSPRGGAQLPSPVLSPGALGEPAPMSLAPVPIPPPLTLGWSGPPEAKVGDTIELAVRAQAGVPLRSLPLQISYPRERLKLLDAAEGTLLRQGGGETAVSRSVDEAAGRVQFGVLRKGADGATGQGTAAVLKFKAVSAGWAEVVLSGAEPLGTEGPLQRPPLPVVHGMQVK